MGNCASDGDRFTVRAGQVERPSKVMAGSGKGNRGAHGEKYLL